MNLGGIIIGAFEYVILPLLAVGCVWAAAVVFHYQRFCQAEDAQKSVEDRVHLVRP